MRHHPMRRYETGSHFAIVKVNKYPYTHKYDGLKTHHRIPIDVEVSTQKEKAKDVRLIFTDLVSVKFTEKDGTTSLLKGRWCMSCR